jgi:hypothetical protein
VVDIPVGDYPIENDQLHQHKDDMKAPLPPLGPYNRDASSGDNPEVDAIAQGDEQREKATGER